MKFKSEPTLPEKISSEVNLAGGYRVSVTITRRFFRSARRGGLSLNLLSLHTSTLQVNQVLRLAAAGNQFMLPRTLFQFSCTVEMIQGNVYLCLCRLKSGCVLI